jgi:hypothetical protein
MIQSMRDHPRVSLLILGLILLSTAPVITRPGWIAHWPSAIYNDLLLSHLPLSQIVHDSLFKWHQAPLWNPYLLSGMPLAADPLAGITYPPNWLAILWPAGYALNLILIGHLVWAGIGAWLLAQSEGVGPVQAMVSAMLFGGAAKLITHFSLGHLGLVSAVSWSPWLLLSMKDLVQAPAGHTLRAAGRAGLVLGLLFLADARWLIPAGLLAACYFLVLHREAPPGIGHRHGIMRALQLGLFAAGVSASLSLPLLELVGLSTRAGMSLVEQSVFSLNAFDLLGTIVYLPVQPEQFVFVGSTALFLCLLAFLKPSRMTWFWGATAFLAVLLAVGPATPAYPLFAGAIPGASLLRVPARFFLLALLAISMLAAKGASLLDRPADGVFQRRTRLLGVGFFLSVILINGAVWAVRGLPALPGLLPAFAAGCGILLLIPSGLWGSRRRVLFGAWFVLLALETAGVDMSLLEMRPLQGAHSSAIADVIAQAPGEQRVFSPTFSLMPLVAAERGIETIEGISPLQLSAYREYLGEAVGFNPADYTVPVPPLDDDINLDAYDFNRLADLNVVWIVSDQPHEHGTLTEIQVLEGVHLYRLSDAGQRVAFFPAQAGGSAQITRWTPNRITIHASGGGRLVLREVMYPGWVGRIDGQEAEIHLEEGLFRAVDIPPGEHEVVFEFEPWSVYLGWGISVLTMAVIWMSARRR